MGRSKKNEYSKSVRVDITLTPQQKEKIQRMAKVDDKSVSALIGELIDKRFKYYEKKYGKDMAAGIPEPEQLSIQDIIAGFAAK